MSENLTPQVTASTDTDSAGSHVSPEDAASAAHLQRLSWLMDNSIRLPGGFRIGLDGFIGLIPGLGDLLGAAISSYIVLVAAKLGAPKVVLGRMGMNVAIETVFGAIPLVGDIFDFTFKANARNYRLVEKFMAAPQKTTRASGATLALLMLGTLALIAVGIAAVAGLVIVTWRALSG